MSSNTLKTALPNDTIIKVQMTKDMTYGEYLEMFQKAKNKGWDVQSFQKGFKD